MKATHIRRRSHGSQIQPMMPRMSYSPQQGTRTKYNEIPPPHQQLQEYKRRLLFGSIPTISQQKHNKNTKNAQVNKQVEGSRKNTQTIMTMGSQTDLKAEKQKLTPKQGNQNGTNASMGSVHGVQVSQFQNGKDAGQIKNNQNEQQNENDNENGNEDVMAGYTIGNQVQDVGSYIEQDNENRDAYKKYKSSDRFGAQPITNAYHPVTQAEMRMQYKYVYDKYRVMSERKKDQQFQRLVNQYKLNKQMLLNQNRRKNESMRAFALIRKHSSLPKLPDIQSCRANQIVLPTFQQTVNNHTNKQNPENKQKQQRQDRSLAKSLSTARFDFMSNRGKQKDKDASVDKYLQEQITYALNTQRLLRQKGIKIDSCCLKNSLINVRKIHVHQVQHSFPSVRLLSNGRALEKEKGKLAKCGYK